MRGCWKFVAPAVSAVLLLADVSRAADVNLDADGCRKQMEVVLKPDVDCLITAHPDAEASANAPHALVAVMTGLACRLPVKFRKSQIYGEWITDERADFPDLNITCSIGSGSKTAEFSAALKVGCTRTANVWACKPILHNVVGLGILGRQLENYVTGHQGLSAQLTKILSGQ